MKFTVARNVEFVPKAYGNAEDAKPAVFKVHFPTMREREELRYYLTDIDRLVQDGPAGKSSIRLKVENAKAILLCVDSIEGLEVNGEKITTGKQFVELPSDFEEMQDEVGGFILQHKGAPEKN